MNRTQSGAQVSSSWKLTQSSMNVRARRSPYEKAAAGDKKLSCSGRLATGVASGSGERIDQETEYRRSLPWIESMLFVVTRTSMLKPRYGLQGLGLHDGSISDSAGGMRDEPTAYPEVKPSFQPIRI